MKTRETTKRTSRDATRESAQRAPHKGAKSMSKKNAGATVNVAQLSKAPGACGGRGRRTIMIENFIASKGAAGATVREIEDALTKHDVRAIRNHVATLYAVKNALKRDDDGRYVIAKKTSKAPKTDKGAKSDKGAKNDKGATSK